MSINNSHETTLNNDNNSSQPKAPSPKQYMFQCAMPHLLELRDKEKNGTITPEESMKKDQILIELYDLVKNYGHWIIGQMTTNWPLNYQDQEDIRSEVLTAFFAHIYDYDPFRSAPTIFFDKYFKGAVRKGLHAIWQFSSKDLKQKRVISEIISKYKTQSIPITNEVLAKESGYSLKVVKKALEFMKVQKVPIEEEKEIICNLFPTPERYIEIIETNKAINHIFQAMLDPDEARLLQLHLNLDGKGPMTYSSMADILGSTAKDVKTQLDQISQKLRRSSYVRGHWPAHWNAYKAKYDKKQLAFTVKP